MATKKAASVLPTRTIRGFGWKRDLPDPRDLLAIEPAHKLPDVVDLRTTGHMPDVWDQGAFGSCTAHGVGAVFAYEYAAAGKGKIMPSRFLIYALERQLEGTSLSDDSGAQVRDGMKVMSKVGVAPEKSWPYTTRDFSRTPTPAILKTASKHRVVTYRRVNNKAPNAALQILAAGHPIAFGFSCFEELQGEEVATTGVLPMPGPKSQMIGGHCVTMVGFNKGESTVLCRNSWGRWGQDGYFTMPWAYAFNPDLASDFWMASVVE